jgi:hypothetical protein
MTEEGHSTIDESLGLGQIVRSRGTILDKAAAAVDHVRHKVYGHPRVNFRRCALLWTAYLKGKGKLAEGAVLDEEDYALMSVLIKIARLENGYHEDSTVDGAGYFRTLERLQEPEDNPRREL